MMQTYLPASRIGDRQTNHKRKRFMSNPLGMHANYARLSITGEYLILANWLFGLMEFDGPISNNTKADRPIQKEKKIVSISFPFITLCLDFKWLSILSLPLLSFD